jgi:hypothetical protein
MKYGAYHVWLRVKGLTLDERQAAFLTLEKARFEPPALINRVLVGSTRVRDSAMGALTEAEQRA